ncbi:MAG: response regulator transcription factor [Chloroflexi bacterium]|nr:response regulator transcription factor [Chloroflexota bacterium]
MHGHTWSWATPHSRKPGKQAQYCSLPDLARDEFDRDVQITSYDRAANPVTVRELELVSHLARGRTNRQIADAMVIARSTAERHVANILNKLSLRSRREVAICAVDHHVV